MKTQSKTRETVSWMFALIFLLLGILNAIYIHHIPAIFYLLISLIYTPPLMRRVHMKIGFGVPRSLKLLFALFILWATLAVGELMEHYEGYLGH